MSVLRTFLGGLAWKALSQFVSQADYGLAGMALVFAGLAFALVDPGLGAAIIQRREIRPIEASTALWTSTAIGVVLAAAGIAIAPAKLRSPWPQSRSSAGSSSRAWAWAQLRGSPS